MHEEVDFEVCAHKAIQERVDDTLCMLAVLLLIDGSVGTLYP